MPWAQGTAYCFYNPRTQDGAPETGHMNAILTQAKGHPGGDDGTMQVMDVYAQTCHNSIRHHVVGDDIHAEGFMIAILQASMGVLPKSQIAFDKGTSVSLRGTFSRTPSRKPAPGEASAMSSFALARTASGPP